MRDRVELSRKSPLGCWAFGNNLLEVITVATRPTPTTRTARFILLLNASRLYLRRDDGDVRRPSDIGNGQGTRLVLLQVCGHCILHLNFLSHAFRMPHCMHMHIEMQVPGGMMVGHCLWFVAPPMHTCPARSAGDRQCNGLLTCNLPFLL